MAPDRFNKPLVNEKENSVSNTPEFLDVINMLNKEYLQQSDLLDGIFRKTSELAPYVVRASETNGNPAPEEKSVIGSLYSLRQKMEENTKRAQEIFNHLLQLI